MVRTLLKLFKTFLYLLITSAGPFTEKYIKQKQTTREMSTNHSLRSAEIAQSGHFSFDKSMTHILGIEKSHLLIKFHTQYVVQNSIQK